MCGPVIAPTRGLSGHDFLASTLKLGALGRQLVQGSLLGLLLRVLSVLAGLLSSVVLARALGPAEYGIYAFVFAIIAILALPVQMGLPTLVVRETAKAVVLEDWPLLRGIWAWATRVAFVGALAMVAAALCWVALFGDAMRTERAEAFLWGLPLVPLLAFGEVRAAALSGLRRIFLSTLPDQILRPLLLAGLVGAAWLAMSSAVTAKTALALSGLAASITFIIGTVFLFHARPAGYRSTLERRVEHRHWLRTIMPLAILSGLQVINQNVDLVMLGLLRSDEEAGLYRIALSASSLTIIGITAINIFIQPYVARLHTQADMPGLQHLIAGGALIACILTCPVVVFFIVFGQELLGLVFGAAYVDAYSPLVILSLGLVSTAFFGMSGVLLTMAGYERKVLVVLFTSITLNLILNAILIPAFGIQGAAAANSLSLFVLNIQLYWLAKKLTTLDSTPIRYFSH